MAEPKIDYTGGSVKYSYTLPCGGSKNVTVEKEGQSSIDANVQGSGTRNGSITITAPLNTSLSEVNEKFKVNLDGNHCTDIEASQRAYDCSCDNVFGNSFGWKTDVINLISANGLAADTEIATYKTESESCASTFNVTVKKNGSENIRVGKENGSVKILEDIKRNKTLSNVTYSFDSTLNSNNCDGISVTQEPYTCNCQYTITDFSWADEIYAITSETLNPGSVIAKFKYEEGVRECMLLFSAYKITNDDESTRVDLTLSDPIFDESDGYWKSTIYDRIPINESLDKITYTFKAKLRNVENECYTTSVIQKGLTCDCADLTVTSLLSQDEYTSAIGITNGTELFQIALGRDACYGNPISISLVGGTKSYNVSYNNDTHKVVLNEDIEENSEKGKKHFVFTVNYNGENCDSQKKEWEQESSYVYCKCENTIPHDKFSKLVTSIPRTGLLADTQIASFVILRERCKNELRYTLTLKGASTTVPLKISWNSLSGTISLDQAISENTTYVEKEYVFLLEHNGDDPSVEPWEDCVTYDIAQRAKIPCNCAIIDENTYYCKYNDVEAYDGGNPVTSGGVPNLDDKIVTFKIKDIESVECVNNMVAHLHYKDNPYESLGDLARSFDEDSLEVTFRFTYGCRIGVNDDYPPLYFFISVGFLEGSGFNECKRFDIMQEGKTPCGCAGMGTYINKEYRDINIPMTGFTDWTTVASGDTAIRTRSGEIYKVCGGIWGSSNVSWLNIDEDGNRVKVLRGRDEGADKDNKFYLQIFPRALGEGEHPDGGITLYFVKYNDDGTEEVVNCDGQFINMHYVDCKCEGNTISFPAVGRNFTLVPKKTNNVLLRYTSYESDIQKPVIWYGELEHIDANDKRVDNLKFHYPTSKPFDGYFEATIDIIKDADTIELKHVANIRLSGICSPQFSSEEHNSGTYIKGSGIVACRNVVPINQRGIDECSCEYITYHSDDQSEFTLDFEGGKHEIGERRTITIEDYDDYVGNTLFYGCLQLVFLDDNGNIIMNGNEPVGSYQNPYIPNDWVKMFFEFPDSTRIFLEAEIIREVDNEAHTFSTNFAYAIMGDDGEYELCITKEATVKTQANDCLPCEEYMYESTKNSRYIIDDCNYIWLNAATRIDNCGMFKLSFADENFNDISNYEGFERWPFITSIGGRWSDYVGISGDKNTGDPTTIYLNLYLADDTDSGTYQGSVCKKEISIPVIHCDSTCTGEECYYYVSMTDNFRFIFDTNSRYYRGATESSPTEHFEIPWNVTKEEVGVPFSFGYISKPIPEEMQGCISLVAATSDEGQMNIQPFTAYTMGDETSFEILDDYVEGCVVGLYATFASYEGDISLNLDCGVALFNSETGERCSLQTGGIASRNVNIIVKGKTAS